jgi:antitoxin component YwqK of YwqJK toxin-antitoxin module
MKKLIAMMLALVMILSLCACSNSGKTEEKDDEKEGGGSKGGTTTVGKLTEVVMTETSSNGSTNTMKAVLEYDDNQKLIATKTYLNGKLEFDATYDKDIEKPLLEVMYDDDGKEHARYEYSYTYDANGNCLEQTERYTDSNGNSDFDKIVKTYDANGNVLTSKEYDDGELFWEYSYTYTATGKIATRTEVRYEENEEHSNDTYSYDEHDNLLSIVTDGEYGLSTDTYENTYDENGKLVEVKVYDDGTLEKYKKYDADGNCTLNVSYEPYYGDEIWRTESTYENGKLVKEVEYSDGDNKCAEIIFTYNADGKLTEHIDKLSDGRSVYSYNQNGDVIGVKTYYDNELRTEYTLTYENVTVSKETAELLEKIVDDLALDRYDK